MTLEERSDLILTFARVLYANGQSTDQTLAAAARLGDTLGLRARILPRWGELQLHANDQDAQLCHTTFNVKNVKPAISMTYCSARYLINDTLLDKFAHLPTSYLRIVS
jgi:hypothetical protein